jgi:Heterokaryon incompatibility protein (HET)
MTEVYQDVSIDKTRQEIRVVQLQPAGTWDEEISCKLIRVSLNEQPYYEALSYVWGTPKITAPITLNDVKFEVTKNLESALRRLRRATSTRLIWIDALCINQKDDSERESQVKLMGPIYSGAKEVLVWLGEHLDPQNPYKSIPEAIGFEHRPVPWHSNTEESYRDEIVDDPRMKDSIFAGFAIVYMMAQKPHFKFMKCFAITPSSKFVANPCIPGGLAGLKDLMAVEWWNRIWTVQEVVLPDIATMVYGTISAPWTMFSHAWSAFTEHANTCCPELFLTMDENELNIIFMLYDKVAEIQAVKSDLMQGKTDLFGLFYMFSGRKATDPRDKVFGMLGMMHSASEQSFINPDYSLTRSQVYEAATLEIIRSTKSLKPIESGVASPGDLSSWVIDWERPPSENEKACEIYRSYMKRFYGLLERHELCLNPIANSMLQVKGILVDRISDTLPLNGMPYSQAMSASNTLVQNSLIPRVGETYVAGGTCEDAHWRTMIGNLVHALTNPGGGDVEYRKARPEDHLFYLELSSTIDEDMSGKQLTQEYRDMKISATSMLHERTFFITNSGFIGIGASSMRVGDDVYVLCGGRSPFVLRSVDDGHFKLIGDCYVHGIMDGEIFDNENTKLKELILK